MVFVFPSASIVVKVSTITLWGSLRLLVRCIKQRSWKYFRKQWRYSRKVGGFKGLLFRGIIANWSEFRFYRHTRHPFCEPTYFSLFGLFNVQRYGKICKLDSANLWSQLYRLTKGDVFKDSHCFVNPRNFSFNDGKLRIVDYGSAESREVIISHGAKILEYFDPAYDREAEKKKGVKA